MKKIGEVILATCAITISIGVLWITNRPVTPKDATWEDVRAEAERGGYRIIRIEELRGQYKKKDIKNLLLVDTRQEWEHRTGHIKGSVNFPVEPTWLSRWQKKGALEKLLGPDKNRFIVFY